MPTLAVPELFARAQGIAPRTGSHRCFYCGAGCDSTYSSKEFVKPSFNGWSGVASPDSSAVCAGCVACLNESADITLPHESRTGQRIRNYSWVVTSTSARAFTKAHVAELRAICLNPPAPPFAIVISDSGQKQLLYRGVVAMDRASPTAMLEEERITYQPHQLAEMLSLCGKLIAATGKPALKEKISFNFARAVMDFHANGEELIHQWERVQSSPLARLATWLSANKEEQMKAYA